MDDQSTTLGEYIRISAAIELSPTAAARIESACGVAASAIETVAEDSLFDTEPALLESTLESCAVADDA